MIDFYHIVIPLMVGFILDSILGDPLWLPHPIRLFGKAITFLEIKLNKGKYTKLKGGIAVLTLMSITYFGFYFIMGFSEPLKYLYYPIASIFVFYGLANRSLIKEALKVERKLSKEGIEAGRKQLSYIVGRDTSQLSENEIRIAVLETLSENLSDGVIAPLFFYALGGVPLMFAYKMINTLDSMIGYKSERFKKFGFFAAKLDDIVNFIPARITALLMVLITLNFKGLKYIFLFGNKHSSPNAGYPEAALAGILNCRFGGSNFYHGKLIDKPFIGLKERSILKKDIRTACVINYATATVFLGFIICLFFRFIF
jgi:adenosylcobinamide-phosphate synthase